MAAVAARITAEQGRLDLLVNNAWAGMSGWPRGRGRNGIPRCGVQPLVLFDAMFTGGVRTHYVALARCTPLLMATPGSLVVTGSRG